MGILRLYQKEIKNGSEYNENFAVSQKDYSQYRLFQDVDLNSILDQTYQEIYKKFSVYGYEGKTNDIDLSVSKIIPTSVNPFTFSYYFVLSPHEVYMKPYIKYLSLLQLLNKENEVMENVHQIILNSNDLDYILLYLEIISFDLVNKNLTFYYKTSPHMRIKQLDKIILMTGNSIATQHDFLLMLFPDHTLDEIIRTKLTYVGVEYSNEVCQIIRYYFLTSNLISEEIKNIEMITNLTIDSSKNSFEIEENIYAIGLGLQNNVCKHYTYYFVVMGG